MLLSSRMFPYESGMLGEKRREVEAHELLMSEGFIRRHLAKLKDSLVNCTRVYKHQGVLRVWDCAFLLILGSQEEVTGSHLCAIPGSYNLYQSD